MDIINALVYDTLLSYWPVIICAVVLTQFRFRIGSLWILIGFAILWAYAVVSETFADVPEKNAVFFIGSVIRIVIASVLVGALAWLGTWIRGRLIGRMQGNILEL